MRDAPLRECLLLLAGLGLLAWPLALVTARPTKSVAEVVATETAEGLLVTDVLVRSAHHFEWFELRRGEEVLGRLQGPALEGEFECELLPHGDKLVVAAAFEPESPETALQIELWAGSMPEFVRNFWTRGELQEEVEIDFHE